MRQTDNGHWRNGWTQFEQVERASALKYNSPGLPRAEGKSPTLAEPQLVAHHMG